MKKAVEFMKKAGKGAHHVLLRLGGFDPRLAGEHAFHYQIRYAGFGLAIVLSGVLAFFAGWHTALSYTHNELGSVFFGIVWSGLIMGLDYLIIIYMNQYNQAWVGPLRILTSITLSLLISTPLILLACHGPIMERLDKKRTVQVDQQDRELATQKKVLIDSPLIKAQQLVSERQNAVLKEASGDRDGGTGQIGIGKITKLKQMALDSAKSQYQALEKVKKAELAKLQASHDKRVADINKNFADDELAQIRVLFELLDEPAVMMRWVMLTLAIVLLETTPIVLKLTYMKTPTPYTLKIEEGLQEAQDEAAKSEIRNKAAMTFLRHTAELDIKSKVVRTKMEFASDKVANISTGIKNILLIADQAKRELSASGLPPDDIAAGRAAIEAAAKIQLDYLTNSKIDEPEGVVIEQQTEGDDVDMPIRQVSDVYKVCIADDLEDSHPTLMNAAMIAKATQLCAHKTSEKEKMEALYEWLLANIPYDNQHDSYSGGYRTAIETWQDKTGVCGEVSVLFNAMARAVGLTASYVNVQVDHKGERVNHACSIVRFANGAAQLVDVCYSDINAQHQKYDVLTDDEVKRRFDSWRTRRAA